MKFVVLAVLCTACVSTASGEIYLDSSGEVTMSLDSSTGLYAVAWKRHPEWTYGGQLAFPIAQVHPGEGKDNLGTYREISFDYVANEVNRTSGVRVYGNSAEAVLWTRYPEGSPNQDPFPVLRNFPGRDDATVHHFGYISGWGWRFGGLQGMPDDSPWMFFDEQYHASIIAVAGDPVSQYFSGRLRFHQGDPMSITAGVNVHVTSFASDHVERTLIVFGEDISAAFENFGSALAGLNGAAVPNTNSAFGTKLCYMTDAYSTYYYRAEPGHSFADTLVAIPAALHGLGVELGCMWIDSMWYDKGYFPDAAVKTSWTYNGNGAYAFVGDPSLFPNSGGDHSENENMRRVISRLGLPVVLHFKFLNDINVYSGWTPLNAAPDFQATQGNALFAKEAWTHVLGAFSRPRLRNVSFYPLAAIEHDWMDHLRFTDPVNGAGMFFANLISATAESNIPLILCMQPTPFFLAAAGRSEVYARIGSDGFTSQHIPVPEQASSTAPDRYLQASWYGDFAYHLRIGAFLDNVSATDTLGLLRALLGGGGLGINDSLANLQGSALLKQNLLRAVLPDGTTVRWDKPATPLERMYLQEATAPCTLDPKNNPVCTAPMLEFGFTTHGQHQTAFLFAYSRAILQTQQGLFTASELGFSGPVFIYDYFNNSGTISDATAAFPLTAPYEGTYRILAPVGPSGMALVGDTGKFATMSKQRISSFSEDASGVQVTLTLQTGEASPVLTGYAPSKPSVTGTGFSAVSVDYNTSSGIFQIQLSSMGTNPRIQIQK